LKKNVDKIHITPIVHSMHKSPDSKGNIWVVCTKVT